MRFRLIFNSLLLSGGVVSCQTTSPKVYESPLYGRISDPFAQKTRVLGSVKNDERFVIKSVVGSTQYIVEIPDAARDYDIEVPLADIQKDIEDPLGLQVPGVGHPVITDRELTSQFPKITPNREDAALVDGMFGVGEKDGPEQSPSYTLSMAKIGQLYQQKKFEYALIEINNMLSFYPNSPQLYKMKGTVLLKLRNHDLAKEAWQRAKELDPADTKLARSLAKLDTAPPRP